MDSLAVHSQTFPEVSISPSGLPPSWSQETADLMLELRKLIMTKGIEAGVKRMREMNEPKSDSYLTSYVIGVLGTTLARDDKLLSESLEVFKAGVEFLPNNAFLNERLADAYLAANKPHLALPLLQHCLELNPLNRGAYQKVKQISAR